MTAEKPKTSESKLDEDKSKDVDRSLEKDKGRSKDARRSRSTSPRRRRRERSPTPKPLRIHVGRLSRNVSKDHLMEIFSLYGAVKNVEMPPDRGHSHLHRGFAYIEFATADEAENAMKHMDGGMELYDTCRKQLSYLVDVLDRPN